ncbi:hypothetical protein TcCL_ESM09281, partial [Trypanosoma cruzi]
MVLPQSSPDAAKDTKQPRQTHVAALQPAAIERVRGCNGDAEEKWGTRRHPAFKASFLVHTSRHCTASSGTMSTRHCTRKGTKKCCGSTWSRGKGSTPIAHSEWLTDVRMVAVQMPRGSCDCSGLRRRREGWETHCGPHPSLLALTPVTSSRQVTCSKDRRRQRRSVH